MAEYDDVMSGKRSAYEAFVRVGLTSYGPLHGVVREDETDGRKVSSLQLAGVTNTRVTLVAKSPRQAGAVVVQTPGEVVECAECIDVDDPELPRASSMRFAPRPGMHVELRRLRPAEIDVTRAMSLFPQVARARVEGAELVVREAEDVFVVVPRPPAVDEGHSSCEITAAVPPDVRISRACPSMWHVDFGALTTNLRCCASPRHHGPPTSGYYPEDCIDVR